MSETNIQNGLSYVPDEIGRCVADTNELLAKIPPGTAPSPEYRMQLQEGLDALWEYGSDECAFSGLCQIVESHSDGVKVAHDFVEGGQGESDGFWVIKFGRPKHQFWTVALGFHKDNANNFSEAAKRVDYFLLPQASYGVVPIGEVEDAFPEGLDFHDTIHELLSGASDELARKLRHRKFFKLDCDEQKYFIDATLDDVDELCAKHNYDIEDMPVGIVGERAYAPSVSCAHPGSRYTEIDIRESRVTGICMALGVLARNQISQGMPVRNAEQLVDKDAGLCLVVRLDAESAGELHIREDDEVYVPISGQDIDVSFDTEAIKHM